MSVTYLNPEPVRDLNRPIKSKIDGAGVIPITALGFGEAGGMVAHLGGRRRLWMPAELVEWCRRSRKVRQLPW